MQVSPIANMWAECEGAGSLRISVAHPTAGDPTELVVGVPFLLVGRAPDCDLVLRDKQVSFRHALLQVIQGRVWCVDLLSRNGTHYDGREREAFWLDADCPVRIGPYSLQVEGLPSDSQPDWNPMVSARRDRTASGVRLEFLNVDGAGQCRLDRAFTLVGSAEICKLRLGCTSVSQVHCALLRSRRGLWVIDLLGRGGTWVNGVHIRCAELAEGDRLEIGKYEIVTHIDPGTALVPVGHASRQRLVPRVRTRSAAPASMPSVPEPEASAVPALSGPSLGHASGADQSLVAALMQQFASMHQQMMSQFQQTTLLTLQMFHGMQHEQRDMIAKELDELRKINRSIEDVQAELARQPQRQEAKPPDVVMPSPPSVPPPSAVQPSAVQPAPHEKVEIAPIVAEMAANTAAFSTAPAGYIDESVPHDAPSAGEAQDMHLLLTKRAAELQKEQQSRWHRLLHGLFGN